MPPFPQWLLKLCQAEVCGILGSCGNLGLLNSLVSVLPSSLCCWDMLEGVSGSELLLGL